MSNDIKYENGYTIEESKPVQCPVCKKSGEKTMFRILAREDLEQSTDYEIARCKGCRLAYVKYPPAQEVLRKNNQETAKPSFFDKKLNKNKADFILSNLPDGYLLQVECGKGALLNLLKQSGFRTLGIDSLPENISSAKELTSEVYNFTFQDFFHYENEFNAVVFINSLNYADNPVMDIEKAIRLINENGYIFIEEDIFYSKMDKLFGKYFSLYQPQKRKYHFSPSLLKKILRSYGFSLKSKKKANIKNFMAFFKSCSNFLKEKWNISNAFLRGFILSPVILLSPLFNLYFYTSNYFKYGVFGDTFLGAFSRSKY